VKLVVCILIITLISYSLSVNVANTAYDSDATYSGCNASYR